MSASRYISRRSDIFSNTIWSISNLALAKAAVIIKLNAITSIATKYRKTIELRLDLQEKNNKDNHIMKVADVP